LVLARSQVCQTEESLAGVKQFLWAAAGKASQANPMRLPAILGMAGNAFVSLFLEAHTALLAVLDGADPAMHPFRHSGSTLMRLLCFCAQSDLAATGLSTDVAAASMYCFLIEGMIYACWCPNASEGVAKRSAHTCFLALRKSMHKLAADEHAAVLGYLWSAWILSQKTEGIHDSTKYTSRLRLRRSTGNPRKDSFISRTARCSPGTFLFFSTGRNRHRASVQTVCAGRRARPALACRRRNGESTPFPRSIQHC